MKNTITALLLLIGAHSYAQDLESILAKHYEAVGNEKLAAVQTIKMSVKMEMMGMSMAQEMSMKRPNKMRSEMDMMGQVIVMIYNGTDSYMKTGEGDFGPIPLGQAQDLVRQADFDGGLYNYQEKGHKVEYSGDETIDGLEYHVLDVVLKGQEEMPGKWYLDANTYLLKYQKMNMTQQGMTMEVENTIEEYNSFDGVMMPVKIVTKVNGAVQVEMLFDSIELNVEIDDSVFEVK